MVKIPSKKILKKSRHLRWNWEQSPENNEKVRYHFVIVCDRNREKIRDAILGQIQEISSGIEQIRQIEGKVENSKLRYLFASYDTHVAPRELQLYKISKSRKKDPDLIERKRGNIEDYVSNFYEKS